MDIDSIRESMKQHLKESRYIHSLGVEEVCYDLALIYGYDMEKAGIAGILHDCAKYLSDDELLRECEEHRISVTQTERNCAFLLHAKVGAFYAKTKYGIEDPQLLDAITYHTTGRPAMTLLEKILFTADYIEPYRRPLPGIDSIRKAAYSDLDIAVLMILENTLQYLKDTGAVIDSLSVETYEYYKKILQVHS